MDRRASKPSLVCLFLGYNIGKTTLEHENGFVQSQVDPNVMIDHPTPFENCHGMG
jgi:hypothetical protein